MNKKQGLRIIMQLIIGGVVGGAFATIVNMVLENMEGDLVDVLVQFITNNYFIFIVAAFILLFIPAVILIIKGRKDLLDYANSDEDDIQPNDKKLNIGLMINSIFIFFLFILFGSVNLELMKLDTSPYALLLFIVLFLVFIICGVILEVVSVKIIQKHDPRIKGDPTKLNYAKEYFESCDEAEKEKISLASYQTFMFNKNYQIALLVLAIFYNTFTNDGFIAVLIAGAANLGNVLSYYINVLKMDSNKE